MSLSMEEIPILGTRNGGQRGGGPGNALCGNGDFGWEIGALTRPLGNAVVFSGSPPLVTFTGGSLPNWWRYALLWMDRKRWGRALCKKWCIMESSTGDMQLIAESYFKLGNTDSWRMTRLPIFLPDGIKGNSIVIWLELRPIFAGQEIRTEDTYWSYFDIAGQKGTGKWTAEAALGGKRSVDFWITEAVHACFSSAMASTNASKRRLWYRSFENNDIPWTCRAYRIYCDTPYMLRNWFLCTGILFVEKSFRALSMEFRLRHVNKFGEGLYYPFRFSGANYPAYHALPGLKNLLFDDFFRNRILEALAPHVEKDYGRLSVGVAFRFLAWLPSFHIFRRFADRTFFWVNLIQAQRIISVLIRMKRTDMERVTILPYRLEWNGRECFQWTYNA